MSNIFYSQVDDAVQLELNARGNAGKKNRSTQDLNFMLGKVANVQLTAYQSGSADPNFIIKSNLAILGGQFVRTGRYLPSSPDEGFLTNPTYTVPEIKDNENGVAYLDEETKKLTDTSRRIGPIITAVSVDIGDHSMGLLNKATVNITIPNPTRDLDTFEDTWLYPGRYVKIDIQHPNSAVITGADTNLISTSSLFGSLSEEIIDTKLKKLYPSLSKDLTAFKQEIRKLNKFSFQGLITSFDFSYTTEGSVDVTISLTGTSNTYTDVSMLMNPNTKKNNKTKPDYTTVTPTPVPTTGENTEQPNGSTELYGLIYNEFENIRKKFAEKNNLVSVSFISIDPEPEVLLPFTFNDDAPIASDHFMLYGQLYPNIQAPPFPARTFTADPSASIEVTAAQSASFQQQQQEALSTYNAEWQSYVATQRYITLGALIQIINKYISSKLIGSAEQYEIKCTDLRQFSNYYPQLTSCIPKDILLLPGNANLTSALSGMNVYSHLKMYPNILKTMSNFGIEWPGVFGKSAENSNNVIFPSRIFINLEYIQTVLNALSEKNTKEFTLNSFLANISARISYATGNAIMLKLVTDPVQTNQLLFADTKYLKPTDTNITVNPYSVPMLANHPNGTIVREFSFQAKLPNNVKNLSYVLNSGTDVSDDEIAPYLNFMYNSKDPNAINKARDKYAEKYKQTIQNLNDAKTSYGDQPLTTENTTKLYKALIEYIKYPFEDIEKSKQLTAPIFPFDVDFTIDGINGLRYGDVLTFEGLPEKYKKNTVFSIIGITHDVDTDGVWTQKVKCIMRPKIG